MVLQACEGEVEGEGACGCGGKLSHGCLNNKCTYSKKNKKKGGSKLRQTKQEVRNIQADNMCVQIQAKLEISTLAIGGCIDMGVA